MDQETREKRCKNCRKSKVKYVEFSPDGAPDYYCSRKCHSKYIKKMWKKGIGWRALPLKKL